MKTRLIKRYLPRQLKVWKNRREETLILSAKELRNIYYTMKFDMELGNLLKNVLFAKKKAQLDEERAKVEYDNIPF